MGKGGKGAEAQREGTVRGAGQSVLARTRAHGGRKEKSDAHVGALQMDIRGGGRLQQDGGKARHPQAALPC